MQNTTPFRELWLKFSEEELLPEADGLLRDAPEVVRNSVTTLHIYNGQNLICQGDPAQAVYIILDGEFIVNTFTIWTYNLADINILIHIVISIHSI